MLLRLGSLAAGLALIVLIMQSIRSPQSIARLDELFGAQDPSVSARGTESETVAARELATKVDRELLKSLNDDKPFRTAEAEAWYHLLAIARDTPKDQLKAASQGSVSYSQFMAQPGHYRGRVVSVSGLAHRVQLMHQDDNPHGITRVYEIVVQPGGTGNRSILYHCLELPPGLEEVTKPRPIRFDGFFLKNRVYGHDLGLDKAPVIVGSSFDLMDSYADDGPSREVSTPWMIGVAVMSALVVGALLRQALTIPRSVARGAGAPDSDSVAAALRNLEEVEDPHPPEDGRIG